MTKPLSVREKKDLKKFKQEIRNAFADYYASEGCSCCQNINEHDKAKVRIGKLLNVKKYEDKSGYDFYAYRTKDESK